MILEIINNGFNYIPTLLIDIGISFAFIYMLKLLGNFFFKRESLGGGDIKLMIIFGMVLGFEMTLFSVVLASFIALPISLIILIRKNIKSKMKFRLKIKNNDQHTIQGLGQLDHVSIRAMVNIFQQLNFIPNSINNESLPKSSLTSDVFFEKKLSEKNLDVDFKNLRWQIESGQIEANQIKIQNFNSKFY